MIYVIIIILAVLTTVSAVTIIKKLSGSQKLSALDDLIKQGRASQAVKLAKQVIAREPNNPGAHYILGKAYLADNKSELALMELKTVNQLGDFSSACPEREYRQTIAQLYKNYNQPEEALKEYLLLIKLEPQNAEFYYQSGMLFENRKRPDKAIQYYQKAISLDTRHSNAHFALGSLYFARQNYIEARGELEIALRFNPDNYKAHFIIGKILRESKNYSQAVAAFEKAMKDPDYKIKALVERGSCYISEGNFEKAAVELERAVGLSKNEGAAETLYARYFLGYCLEKLRRIEGAVEQWEKIYAKKPGFKDVAEKLSQYQDLRQDDMMKEYLTCSRSDFVILAAELTKKLGFSVQDSGAIPEGSYTVALEDDDKWVSVKKMTRLIWFLRAPNPLADDIPRNLLEEMKKNNLTRGMIFSSSNFSRKAAEWTESRPIELMGKDKLAEALQGLKLPQPAKARR
ncbi:MAG: tetratricopeptide repeat protein [Spirochaetales bacterium]|jgi:tetratricopeptide (TPR) repeat protein|nr:tetratricopeptide repeat protein [Spirochaetales bacterium]